ncbi:MAG: hypothetical protein GEU73_04305 [Chloroflexi bacterium]|nr:hypothetical protein [Chloroflexota bacterium]
MEGAPDDAILLVASMRGAILITHNERDFRLLYGAWQRWPREWGTNPAPQHAGILLMKQEPAPILASAILDLLKDRASFTNAMYQWTLANGWR